MSIRRKERPILVTAPVPMSRLHSVLSVGMPHGSYRGEPPLTWPLNAYTNEAYINLNPYELADKLREMGIQVDDQDGNPAEATARNVGLYITLRAQRQTAAFPGYREWFEKHKELLYGLVLPPKVVRQNAVVYHRPPGV